VSAAPWKRREQQQGVFPARFESVCRCCGEEIEEGAPIVRIWDHLKKKNEYVHAGECAEEWSG
jgi:hypothetical protein